MVTPTPALYESPARKDSSVARGARGRARPGSRPLNFRSFRTSGIGDRDQGRAVSSRGRIFQEVLVRRVVLVFLASAALVAAACGRTSTTAPTATAADAKGFLDEVDRTFTRLWLDGSRAGWVAQNFITPDTEALDARATQAVADASSR